MLEAVVIPALVCLPFFTNASCNLKPALHPECLLYGWGVPASLLRSTRAGRCVVAPLEGTTVASHANCWVSAFPELLAGISNHFASTDLCYFVLGFNQNLFKWRKLQPAKASPDFYFQLQLLLKPQPVCSCVKAVPKVCIEPNARIGNIRVKNTWKWVLWYLFLQAVTRLC